MAIFLKYNVLSPKSEYNRRYGGKKVTRVMKEIPGRMLIVWRLDGSKIFEDLVKWDNSPAELFKFYSKWRCLDKKDMFSTIWIEAIVQGEQNKKTGKGIVDIILRGRLEVKVGSKNMFADAMRWVYFRTSYKDIIKRHLKEARERIDELDNHLRKMFEIKEKK